MASLKALSFVFILTAAIAIISCAPNPKKPFSIDVIYGDWVGGFNSTLQVSITPDSLFWCLKDKFTIAQKYQYRISEDSIFLFSEEGMIDKLLLMPEKDMLICCNYKDYIDSNRIDEVTALRKINDENKHEENQLQNFELHKDIIIVPENQIGIFLIAFSQKEGEEVNFDELGNSVFTFDKGTNVLFTQGKEDIKKMAFNQFEIYKQTQDGELILYPVIAKCNLEQGNDKKELMAIMEGFNQGSREILNSLVEKDISGNVLWFNIGTEAAIHNKSDSMMYNGQYYKRDYWGKWMK